MRTPKSGLYWWIALVRQGRRLHRTRQRRQRYEARIAQQRKVARKWRLARAMYREATGVANPPLTQIPAPFCVVRRAAWLNGDRGLPVGPFIAFLAARLLVPQRRWPTFKLSLELVTVSVISIGFMTFYLDFKNREEDRVSRAWSLIADIGVSEAGNVGLAEAIETLAEQDIDLSEVRLQGTYLRGANLEGANLINADFSSILEEVMGRYQYIRRQRHSVYSIRLFTPRRQTDLRGANFRHARLEGASFLAANLEGVIFRGSDLRKAHLEYTNLFEANFEGAFLDAASLQYAVNITSPEISTAASICGTTLPWGAISYRDCPDRAPEGHVEPLPYSE